MIVGIGCDIVDHKDSKRLEWSKNQRVQKRIFSSQELDIAKFPASDRFLSGRFAAKEALLKCLGTGMRDGISLTDISILQTNSGQPFIHIQGEVKNIADHMGIINWHVSISHTEQSSCAFVIAEK